MKKDIKISKDKFAVIKKNGKVIHTKKADKGLRVEYDDSLFEVNEKTESKLTKEEKAIQKVAAK